MGTSDGMAKYTLSDVTQTYGDRTVLNVPRLEIAAGEVFAMVGPSGAGKSTLLRLLALLEPPATGTVALSAGEKLVTRDTATIEDRRRIAMVFQRPALLSRSVRSNVAYGLRVRGNSDGQTRIDRVLERVSMLPLAEARPQTLSGGEMQRVAVARALVVGVIYILLWETLMTQFIPGIRLLSIRHYTVSTMVGVLNDPAIAVANASGLTTSL